MSLYLEAAKLDWTFPFCPRPPSWTLDWSAIPDAFECVRTMRGCVQDRQWHAEGDVFDHTRLTCEALVAQEDWRSLPGTERSIVFAATLFHDVAKPMCTQVAESGAVSSGGHALRGARLTRGLLYRRGETPLAIREAVCGLIRFHGLPLWFLNKPSPQRAVVEASQTARCDWLGLVATADALGRKCQDQAELIERVALFTEQCRENSCQTAPRQFASDHARFAYFQKDGASLEYEAYDDTQFDVTLMSGLPGAGKDTWLRTHATDVTIISLDELRAEMAIDPEDEQGSVAAKAKALAQEHLRARRPFVWNATNISRQMRRQVIGLFAAYSSTVPARKSSRLLKGDFINALSASRSVAPPLRVRGPLQAGALLAWSIVFCGAMKTEIESSYALPLSATARTVNTTSKPLTFTPHTTLCCGSGILHILRLASRIIVSGSFAFAICSRKIALA